MRGSPTSCALLVLTFLLASCISERRFLIMEELQPGAGAGAAPDGGAELVGEVTGAAHYRQVLTIFSLGNLHGAEGQLRTGPDRGFLQRTPPIPLLDPLFARVAAVLEGTTRVDRAGRVAMGRALLAARELGADALVAPRVEVVTRSLTFLIPLGWLYSTGAVEVSAKAVRLDPRDAVGAAAADAKSDPGP